MIVSLGNPSTNLYVKNILSEIFPEFCFSEKEEITAKSSVAYDDFKVSGEININNEVFTAVENYSDHPNRNLTTTCALGKAVISYAVKQGKSIPPYGVLVGVRPFKIASGILESSDELQTAKKLAYTYLISQEKIPLLIDTARYDLEMRKSHHPKDCSIYISIPFCPSRCNYCSFISSAIPTKLNLLDQYVDNLISELKLLAKFIEKNSYILKSVYIGGGTPTVLESEPLSKLINAVTSLFDLSNSMEFTVEAGRPDTITEKKIEILKNSGVDRVCVNCQTTNDDVLKKIGRNHTRDDFFKAFKTVKEYGFKTVNTDIIAGLEGETFASFKNTIEEVISLSPESITVHTLALKKSAKLKSDGKNHTLDKNISDFIDYAKNRCITLGYQPYYLYKQKYTVGNHENVGYCLNGHESYYNIAMMNEIQTVFGVGAGATTKITDVDKNGKIGHFENYKYPTEYIKDSTKMLNNFLKLQEYLDL